MVIGTWNLMFFTLYPYCIAKIHRLHFSPPLFSFPYADVQVMAYSIVGQDKQRRRKIQNDSCCVIKSLVIRRQHFVTGSSNSRNLEEWNLTKISKFSEFFFCVFSRCCLCLFEFYFNFVIHNVLGSVTSFLKLSNLCVL